MYGDIFLHVEKERLPGLSLPVITEPALFSFLNVRRSLRCYFCGREALKRSVCQEDLTVLSEISTPMGRFQTHTMKSGSSHRLSAAVLPSCALLLLRWLPQHLLLSLVAWSQKVHTLGPEGADSLPLAAIKGRFIRLRPLRIAIYQGR